MSDVWFEAARAVVVVNAALLAALAAVWGRNYREHAAKHTLGLLVFALVLLAEKALALYLYTFHPVFHTWLHEAVPAAQQGMMALSLLELLALLFLVRITLE